MRNVEMATKVMKETKSMSAAEAAATEVDTAVSSVKCCCCGLVEECTHAYIARVRERYEGRWVCGLCAEAVKEEREREKIVISMDEALKRHIKFYQQFKSSNPPNNTNDDFILVMKQILFRTLDSPRKERFTCRPLGRSNSCFSTMQGTPTQADTE
ncbi:uncharacterized protein LOC113847822 [Abrus precatorius]|uniref:Uncharacterized protein LOC113847822 n=1 Tax=Abrus precatorius TaxID=3816 RepID=A0A8B8JN53_ABRPR|nr:uncharacterized protein LOC113847822 [Abrus precatorius]